MVTPFPGMDPYLEHPALWPGGHTRLLIELSKRLAPQIRPRYAVSVEERIFVEIPEQQKIPDLWVQQTGQEKRTENGGIAVTADAEIATPVVVEVQRLQVRQHYLQILDFSQNQKVVCVVELASPSNKKPGAGRRSYRRKQRSTLASETHLVEIDLLRTGEHVLAIPYKRISAAPHFDYLISVNRWPQRARFEIYPLQLHDRLPKFGVPLVKPDADVAVDLQAAFDQVYEDGGYAQRVRYDESCIPPLPEDGQNWASQRWAAYRRSRPDLFPKSS